jgi:hypothetical protein
MVDKNEEGGREEGGRCKVFKFPIRARHQP